MQARRANTEVWPAPARGLLRAGTNVGAPRDAAEVLDNFICTATGARVRGGAQLFATTDGAVDALLTYQSGAAQAFFAATLESVYDISNPADPEVAPVPAIAGLTSGDWSSVQFATSGGQFLLCVNGADYLQRFDGTEWHPATDEVLNVLVYEDASDDFEVGETITGGTSGATAEVVGVYPSAADAGTLKLGEITGGPFTDGETITGGTSGATADADGDSAAGSTVAITGVDTRDLSFVWSHMSRPWFVEKDTLSAWYLGASSIGGSASEFPLDSVFRLGGVLLFGGSWSLDSGDGPDDLQVFVTSEGEIAVYSGTDPSSSTTWALVGRYQIGRPLHKNAWFRAGGDLMIVTEDGIVSVAEALRKDRTALQSAAITAPIEDLWREVVAGRTTTSRFPVAIWPTRTLFMIGVPSSAGVPVALVANARTGAWSRMTGWDARSLALYGDQLYFGTADGQVCRADAGGNDLGAPFSAVYVPKFQEFGSAGDKFALHARATWKENVPVRPRMACFANYAVGQLPTPGFDATEDVSKWGGGAKWGDGTKWGGSTTRVAGSEWQSVSGAGFSLSPALVIGSNRVTQLQFDLVSIHLRLEEGRAI